MFGLRPTKHLQNQYRKISKAYHVKSFEEIPCHRTYLHRKPNLMQIHDYWIQQHKVYGPICKLQYFPGGEYTVLCSSPSDNRKIFLADGVYPIRDNLKNLVYVRECLGEPMGLMNENGPNWKRLRSNVNKKMLSKKYVGDYTQTQLEETQQIIHFIDQHLDENNEIENFSDVLHRWAFDMTGIFLLNTKLRAVNNKSNEKSAEMINCTLKMFNLMGKTLYKLPIWKLWPTEEIKQLKKCQKQQLQLATHFIHMRNDNKDILSNHSFIEFIMNNDSIHDSEKLLLISDLLLSGIDTTANASIFTLYCLALNQTAQTRLRHEIKDVVKKHGVTGESLEQMSYMKACIQETHRIFPFVTSLSRRSNRDLVLSGYKVPIGTHILSISNCVNNYDQKYFEDPHLFKPERWLNRTQTRDSGLVLTGPFGFGARKCVGRKFAIQEIQLLLITLLSAYNISYHGKSVEISSRLVSYPSRPINFRFKKVVRNLF